MIDAFGAIASSHWLILPDALQRMIAIAERDFDHQALATRAGVALDNTRTVDKRGNVAIVPVIGPVFRYANMFTRISGATSTQVLATDIQTALDDPAIKAIVLNIDSPGGEAAGINELAQMIYSARSKKPITAYVGGQGASAAYWIASAASQIVIDATALVGSIGVVATVEDTTERDAKSGKRTYQIVSSNSPNKRPDIATEAGRAQYQTVVDRLAEEFVNAVARNRGTNAKTVMSKYGAGGVLVGRDAVAAGMADRIGSLESVIANATSRTASATTSTATDLPTPRTQTIAELEAESARIVAAEKEAAAHEIQVGWDRAAAMLAGKQKSAAATGARIGHGWDNVVAKFNAKNGGIA